MLLAQISGPSSTNAFDSGFFGWLIVTLILLANLAVAHKKLKRSPSIDVDLVKLNAELRAVLTLAGETKSRLETLPSHAVELATLTSSLSGVHQHLSRMDARLTEGDKIMAGLRERQSVNAAVITEVKGDLHDTKTLCLAIAAKLKVSR